MPFPDGPKAPPARRTTESPKLTPAEANVQRLIARGLLNKQIAHQLNIAESTVKSHIQSIFHKISATNRVQAALEWHGIVWRDAPNRPEADARKE